jgi:hypothetical protein
LAAAVCTAFVILIAGQIAWSIPHGIVQGEQYRANRAVAARLLRNYREEPAPLLGRYLFYPEGQYVKQWAPVLQRHHWSVFSRSAASRDYG